MNKIILSTIISAAALTASAQTAYDAGEIAQTDLDGSARYVGMGGALNALGADISLMGSNPAGIGLYRHSDVSFTLGGVISGQKPMAGHDRSRASVDQGGAVFSYQTDDSGHGLQFINFGINYKKNRNFFSNNIVNVENLCVNQEYMFSQTIQIADIADACYQADNWANVLADVSAPIADGHDGIVGEVLDENYDHYCYYGIPSSSALYKRSAYGSGIEADLNLSFNSSDRFYYGISLGIHDLDYNRDSYYAEDGVDGHYYDFSNWYRMKGSGFDVKLGFICRPIEDSPFRIGVAVNTPVWYNMTVANGTTLYMDDEYVYSGDSGDRDMHFHTPWKFNVSLGHTIGNFLAIGAEYEYADYSTCRFSNLSCSSDYSFRNFNEDIQNTLKAQHTVKVGVEVKPVAQFSIRLGYNYLTSMYDKDAYKSIYYAEPYSDTDYTNWKGINRITCGLGYRWHGGYLDVAYQYQTQKGDFYAFDNYWEENGTVYTLKPTTIHNNRSQIVATLGFSF